MNTPRNTPNDVDPVDTLVARFNERSAGILRELLSDLRVSQRRPAAASTRHRIAPEDLEPVDELTRERARQLIERHVGKIARGRR